MKDTNCGISGILSVNSIGFLRAHTPLRPAAGVKKSRIGA
jgi:hypothetical protein